MDFRLFMNLMSFSYFVEKNAVNVKAFVQFDRICFWVISFGYDVITAEFYQILMMMLLNWSCTLNSMFLNTE